MPRTRKVEVGHEETVPLSLAEVQLATANSIHGDEVDERGVHMAVQGYQLLLQGSLRNSHSEVTRELDGNAGYYRNIMRGVAQVFGLDKRDAVDSEIIKIGSSSENSDSEEAETSEDDWEAGKHKRRKLETARGSDRHASEHTASKKQGPPDLNTDNRAKPVAPESQQVQSEDQIQVDQQTKEDEEPTNATPITTRRHKNAGSEAQTPASAGRSDTITSEHNTPKKKGPPDLNTDNRAKPVAPESPQMQSEDQIQTDQKTNEDGEPVDVTPITTRRHKNAGLEAQTRASPQKFRWEDFQGMLETLAVPAYFTLLSDTKALRTLEKGLLPGTWMLNRKILNDIDFLAPEESENYFMIRCIKSTNCPFPTDEDQWQLILIKNLKRHCASVGEGGENRTLSKPTVFLFDSSNIGLQTSLFLGIWNFINGVLRSSYYIKHKLKNPKKAHAQMLKHILTNASSNIVRVRMPVQPCLADSGIYMLANIFHLSKNNNMSIILNSVSEDEESMKTKMRLGYGKKKAMISVSVREICAKNAYDASFVEPMFAL